MKKIVTLCIILLFIAEISFAQKRAAWWFFGQNAGLHFDSGVALPVLNGALNTSGGSSAISDTNGNLLFYTDGVTVFSKQNTPMPNGFGLLGGNSSTQSAQIVPLPGSSSLYYIFTTASAGDTSGFRYSVVDMNMNDSLGDVFIKNTLVRNNLPEKLTAVANADGSGYWILTHDWGTNAFYAYSLTAAGFDTNAVVSNAGTVYSDSIIQNTFGQMKFSPDGKKIAAAIGYQGIFEILDFDNSTGVVSNPIDIKTDNAHCYGVEFSADNSKLYVTYYSPFFDQYYLDQYDLSSGDATTIINSKTNLSTSDEQLRGMQLGPDHKVYVVPAFFGFLNVVNHPDSAGTACEYEDNALDLGGYINSLTLPGFVQSYFNEGSISTGIQNLPKSTLSIFPNPATNKIYFSLPSSNYYKIELKNETGQIVFSKQFNQKPNTIDVSHLANGIYLVSIKSSAQNFEGKFLKQ